MNASAASPHKSRPGLVTAAGIAIILLSAGAAALPFIDRVTGVRVIGIAPACRRA